MTRLILGSFAAAALAALAACDGGETRSDIVLTSPSSGTARLEPSSMTEAFGPAVDAAARAAPDSPPRDPTPADVGAVSYTAEPIDIPAD